MTDTDARAPEIIWDGGRTLALLLPPGGPGVTTYLAADLSEGGRTLLARRRSRLGAAESEPLMLATRLPDFAERACLVRIDPDGHVSELDIVLDETLRPDEADAADAVNFELPASPSETLIGVRRGDAGRIGPPLMRVGPFLTDQVWLQGRVDVALTEVTGGGWQLRTGEPAQSSLIHVARLPVDATEAVAIEARSAVEDGSSPDGWLLAPLDEGDALLLFGAPGVRLNWRDPGGGDAAGRELVFVMRAGRLACLPLDDALRASHGQALASLGGGTRALVTAEAAVARGKLERVFSPHDPRALAIRLAARRYWLREDTALARAFPEASWQDPFAAGGWPAVLIQTIQDRSAREQAMLAEWALVDATAARLMGALKLLPESMPHAERAASLLPRLGALADPRLRDRLRVAAALSEDTGERRVLEDLGDDLGRIWLPIGRALGALDLLGPDAASQQIPTGNDEAMRGLLLRWCEIAGEPGIVLSLSTGAAPFAAASRLAHMLPPASVASTVLQSGFDLIDRQVQAALPQPETDMTATLAAAGRLLMLRHAIRAADAAAGLDKAENGTGASLSEEERLNLGLLRRMRAALPQQIDAYLTRASGGDAAPLQRRIGVEWGQAR